MLAKSLTSRDAALPVDSLKARDWLNSFLQIGVPRQPLAVICHYRVRLKGSPGWSFARREYVSIDDVFLVGSGISQRQRASRCFAEEVALGFRYQRGHAAIEWLSHEALRVRLTACTGEDSIEEARP